MQVQCALQQCRPGTGSYESLQHLEWLRHAHIKYARGLIRRLNHLNRCRQQQQQQRKKNKKGKKKHGAGDGQLNLAEQELATRLRARFGATVSLDELLVDKLAAEVVATLHCHHDGDAASADASTAASIAEAFAPSSLKATSLPSSSNPECESPATAIETTRLLLRPFTAVDLPAVTRWAGDQAVSRMCTMVPHPYSEAHARFFLERVCTDQTNLTLAVALRGEQSVVGCISLDNLERRQEAAHDIGGGGSASIGYWFGKPFWGRGYATEAARALVAHGFSALKPDVIHGRHFVENPASGAVLAKIGFRLATAENRAVSAESMFPCLARGEKSSQLFNSALRASNGLPMLVSVASCEVDQTEAW